MSFDRSSLTNRFLMSSIDIFTTPVFAYATQEEIPYSKITSYSEADINALIADSDSGTIRIDDVRVSKDNRHAVMFVPQLTDENGDPAYSKEIHSIILASENGSGNLEVIAVAVQSHKNLSGKYVSFELVEDNKFVHLKVEENARALYEDLLEISAKGLRDLTLAYDPKTQDIILTDGKGNLIDSANIVPLVSGVDPSGIVYTEGEQVIKGTKIWADETSSDIAINLSSGFMRGEDAGSQDNRTIQVNGEDVTGSWVEKNVWESDDQTITYKVPVSENDDLYAGTLTYNGIEYKVGPSSDDETIYVRDVPFKLSDFVKTDADGNDLPRQIRMDATVSVLDIQSPEHSPITVEITDSEIYTEYKFSNITVEIVEPSSDLCLVRVRENGDEVDKDSPVWKNAVVTAVAAARAVFLEEYQEYEAGKDNYVYKGTSVSKLGVSVVNTQEDDSRSMTFIDASGLRSELSGDFDETPEIIVGINEERQTHITTLGSDLYIKAEDHNIILNEALHVGNDGYIAGAPLALIRGSACMGEDLAFDFSITKGWYANYVSVTNVLVVSPDPSYLDDEFINSIASHKVMVEVVGFGNTSASDGYMTPNRVDQTLRCCGEWESGDSAHIMIDLTIVQSWFSSLSVGDYGLFVIRVYDLEVMN